MWEEGEVVGGSGDVGRGRHGRRRGGGSEAWRRGQRHAMDGVGASGYRKESGINGKCMPGWSNRRKEMVWR